MTNRFLGIDYGTKRIGIAISDEEGKLAFPKEIVLNSTDTLKKIGEIIKKEAEINFIPNQNHSLSKREIKHRISMKLEHIFDWDLSKKHFKKLRLGK